MKALPFVSLLLSLWIGSVNTQGQDLSEHRWKNRILLVLTSDTLAPVYRQQLDSIGSDPEGVAERKLVIYKVTPSVYQQGMANGKWVRSPGLYTRYHRQGNTFDLVLIGLDGSVKRRTQVLTPMAEIYSWIDSMPMRREELRRKEAGGS